MKKRKGILSTLLCTAMILSAVAVAPAQKAQAASTESIPAYEEKDVFATDTVKVSGLTVKDASGNSITKAIEFTIYNSTKQEVQEVVSSSNGVIPDLNLVKNHNYIFFVDDTEYKMQNAYVWVQENGKLFDIKSAKAPSYNYSEVTNLTLVEKNAAEENKPFGRRANFTLPVYQGSSTGIVANLRFKLVSEVETIEVSTDNNDGKLKSVSVLEDVDYMVTVESDVWGVDTFPLTVKDKSEYDHTLPGLVELSGGRYSYDHSNCSYVDEIRLVSKGNAHDNDTTITSDSGNTTVTGFNFKDLLLKEKKLNKSIQELAGKNYDVIDIKAVNPYRYEVAKLSTGEYTITEKLSGTKQAAHIYYIDKDNNLKEVNFQQVGNKVTFTMNSLSLYPIVIEYGNEDVVSGNKLLSVKVVDADNNPISGVQLCLKPSGTTANSINFISATDAAGEAVYQCGNNEATGSAYELCVAEGGSYTCSSPKSIIFGAGSDNKTYIASVDGTTYTGSEVTLVVAKAGGEDPDPGPVADNRTLSVKVVDESGNPVEGVELELRWDGFSGFGSLAFTSATDAEGKASYICGTDPDEMPGDYYELHPTENSGYTCNEPITVIFGEDADGTFVEYVGEDEVEYTGEELTLVVTGS